MTAVITSVAASDRGCVRANNEDSGYVGRWLFAVADGMGGHAAGEVASSIAINNIARCDVPEAPDHIAMVLGVGVKDANDAIRRHAKANPETFNMGTTLTAILWSGYAFAVAHIGDSRAYRLRSGNLCRLTDDHSLGNLVANAPSTLAPIISRYLDGRPDRSPDLTVGQSVPGDRYLLCSDGLTSVLSAKRIGGIISGKPSKLAVGELIEVVNSHGGPDNITVILIDVDSGFPQVAALPPRMLGAAE